MKCVNSIILITLVIIVVTIPMIGISACTKKQEKTVPNPPSEVQIINKTSKQIEIAWKDSNNELGYRVYRDGTQIAQLPQNTKGYIDYDIKPSTIYTYEIAAYNELGESDRALVTIKSNNPPIAIRFDKIGVKDNGEDLIRELIDGHGEIYIGIVVRDGTNRPQGIRLPVKDFYNLADDGEYLLGDVIYSSGAVGEYLNIEVLGLEHDFAGTGDDLLIEAMNQAVMSSMGTLPSIMLTIERVDFKKEITEIGGFRDDFLGEYNVQWDASDNWGIGSHQKDLDKGGGEIGLRIWYTILSPGQNVK